MSRRTSIVAALVVVVTVVLGAAAVRAAETITTDTACCTFTKPEFLASEGERPQLSVNSDEPHNVTAKMRGTDGRPLFKSRSIDSGSTPVEGAQYLDAGRYAFTCSIHPGMEAALVVGDAGTPVARPKVRITIVRQSLASVQRTGELRLMLRSGTGASDVVVSARGAGRSLGREGRVRIGKGASRGLRLTLTKRGRNALRNRMTATVSVNVSVPYGNKAMAERLLR